MAPQAKKKRPRGNTVMHRLFVTRALDACIGLALGHAVGARDRDLAASLKRIEALLDHEMKTFLQLPMGVKDE